LPLTVCGLLAACVPYISPPSISCPVKEQEVPVIVAIGPFDTAKIAVEGAPLGEDISSAIQGQLKDALSRIQIFKDVVILKLPAGAKNPDAEQILAAARAEHADLLLVGEVKEFSAELPAFLFGSQYDVGMKLQAKLYNVPNGAQIWKKTEKVNVRKDGSGVKRVESLDAIVRYVAVPPITAGILPSLVEYVQTEYAASLHTVKGRIATESSEVFGAAELAKIDAEMAPPATKTTPKDHAYAVVIGVEDYRDLPKVDYAKRDAELIRKYLVHSLGYRENNIVLLLNDRVTRSQMEARLEKWLPKQVGENKDAEIFVYYGGHGAPDPSSNQAFLVPYDGDPSYLETTAYPLKRLYDTLSKLPSHNITVVIDSCFSGTGGRSVIAKGVRPMLIQVENPLLGTENMVVISAAAGNQISSAYPQKRHGLFTYYFLKGLQGEADADKNGVVDVEELYGYVKPHVEADARRMNTEQSPQLLPGADLLGTRAKAHLIELKR
jgi:hypothetical protein